MPRQRPNSIPYNAHVLLALAEEVEKHAALLKSSALTVKKRLGKGQAIRINYSHAVASGLLGIRNMVRNIEQKLDKGEIVSSPVEMPEFLTARKAE